jgi:hypothetical protein
MVSPVRGDCRRCQAETPLIDLFKLADPALKTLKDLLATVQPHTTEEDATKRLTKATNWLNEDVDKAREIVTVLHGKPPGWIG